MRKSTLVAAGLALFTATAFAGDNPRVFITDSQSWEMGGGGVIVDSTGASRGSGGARPQTAEIIKTFNQRCPNVIITSRKDKADYIVLLDHEGGKDVMISHDNKIVVFNNATGDAIFSRSTRALGNAVKDACRIIYRDFSRRAAVADSNKQVEASVNESSPQTVTADDSLRKVATVHVNSSPTGADIMIDGKFVGSTPSNLQLAPGEHTISVEKNGFAVWSRTIQIVPGDVNLIAELKSNR